MRKSRQQHHGLLQASSIDGKIEANEHEPVVLGRDMMLVRVRSEIMKWYVQEASRLLARQ